MISRKARVRDIVGIYRGEIQIPSYEEFLRSGQQWNPRTVYNGRGVLSVGDGSWIAGTWDKGKCLRGVCCRQGTMFRGEFAGFGELTLPSGEVLRGVWGNGELKQHGFFTSIVSRFSGHSANLEAEIARSIASKCSDLEEESFTEIQQNNGNNNSSNNNIGAAAAAGVAMGGDQTPLFPPTKAKKKTNMELKPITPVRYWFVSPLAMILSLVWIAFLPLAFAYSWLALFLHGIFFLAVVAFFGYSTEHISRYYRLNPFCFSYNISLYWATALFWFLEIVPYIKDTHYHEAILYFVICGIGAAVYFSVYVVDPGFLPLKASQNGSNNNNNSSENGENEEKKEGGVGDELWFKWCNTCNIRRPLRAKHCSDCGRCVAKFDHHCPAFNTCIGANNHKFFVLACVIGLSCQVWAWRWLHIVLGSEFDAIVGGGMMWKTYVMAQKYPRHFSLFMHSLAYTTGGFLLCLSNFTCGALFNLTTNETVNWRKYPYLTKEWPVPRDEETVARIEKQGLRFKNCVYFLNTFGVIPQVHPSFRNSFSRGWWRNILIWMDFPGFRVDWKTTLHVKCVHEGSKVDVV